MSSLLWQVGGSLLVGFVVAGVVVPLLMAIMTMGHPAGFTDLTFYIFCLVALIPFLIHALRCALRAYATARACGLLSDTSDRVHALRKLGLLVVSSHGFYIAATTYLPDVVWNGFGRPAETSIPLASFIATTLVTLAAFFATAQPTSTAKATNAMRRSGVRQLGDAAGLCAFGIGVPAAAFVLISQPELRDFLTLFTTATAALFSALATLQLVQAARTFAGQQNKLFSWPNRIVTIVIAGAVAAAVLHASAGASVRSSSLTMSLRYSALQTAMTEVITMTAKS